MSSEFGSLLKISVFGQSHGRAIGVVVDGLPAGEAIDLEELTQFDNPIEMIKKEAERKLINEVLMRFDRNKTKAADYLKIPRPLLYQKMKRLRIRL